MGQKINFRYAVGVAPVLVLKVSNIAFPSTWEFFKSSAKQLRFVTALYRRQVVQRKGKSTIFPELSQTQPSSTSNVRTEVRMRTAVSHDPSEDDVEELSMRGAKDRYLPPRQSESKEEGS